MHGKAMRRTSGRGANCAEENHERAACEKSEPEGRPRGGAKREHKDVPVTGLEEHPLMVSAPC